MGEIGRSQTGCGESIYVKRSILVVGNVRRGGCEKEKHVNPDVICRRRNM
ncbi:MAG: hypothetical protein N2595_10250 [bacterium]|nr:hypothetical protein [bacterium]